MADTAIIAAIITSIVTGIIGIVQIYLTRKSLENANRPYITIYNEVINIVQPIEFLIIKNSGNSPAKIDNIIYDEIKLHLMNYVLSNEGHEDEFESCVIQPNNLISYFKNSTIAPNQSFRIPINNAETKFENLDFKIIYRGVNSKKYKENFSLNLRQNIEMTFIKSNSGTTIEDTLQEILKKM